MAQVRSRSRAGSIICGNARQVLGRMRPASIASIVTDPPYGLEFMGKDWDRLGGTGSDRSERQVAWHRSWAAAAFRVLKPGGYLLAMGGTRTCHRLACALEKEGFEIRDCLCWIYASGFPKSVDLARLIGRSTGGQGRPASSWAGWGTALKPAWEPIIVARRPVVERNLSRNVLAFGTGGLNARGCLIPYLCENAEANNWYRKDKYRSARQSLFQGRAHSIWRIPSLGRFPANVLCDNQPPAGPLAGVVVGGSGVSNTASRGLPIFRKTPKTKRVYGAFRNMGIDYPGNPPETGLGDGILGPYTRFFRLPIEGPESLRFFVIPKPSKGEKGRGNDHPTVKPVRLFRYLIRLITPPGGIVCDPFLGSGTAAVAAIEERATFVGIEADSGYVAIARERVRAALRARRNVYRGGTI